MRGESSRASKIRSLWRDAFPVEARDLGHCRELGLDLVRGFAILLAMGYHINAVDAGPIMNVLLQPGLRIGWAGVDLFFVLSGFLIGGMILREANLTGRLNYKRFLLRRILRLWPTLYTFLLAMLLFGFPARDFFWQISLHIQGYAPTKSATHLWSLAVEEQFYLILGLGFPLLAYAFGWKKTLPWILIGLLFVCPALRALAPAAGFSHWQIYVLTHFRIDALACGVLLSFFASELPAQFDRLLRKRMLWAGLTALGVLFLWNVEKSTVLGEVAGFSISWMTSAAALLLLFKSRVPLVLRWPSLSIAFLGQISYPLYLWHVAVLKLGDTYLPLVIGEGHGTLRTLLIYAAAIAVAFIVTMLIERPIMRIRDKILPQPRKVRIASFENGVLNAGNGRAGLKSPSL